MSPKSPGHYFCNKTDPLKFRQFDHFLFPLETGSLTSAPSADEPFFAPDPYLTVMLIAREPLLLSSCKFNSM